MLAPDSILQNRYRIVRKLGQGGMGAIYEAIDQRVNCVVALKETLMGANSPLREAFHREAELLANLRHPLLPKVMDYFDEGDGEFLVMEFIAGNDLLELLELRGGPLPQLQVLTWAVELLKLLEYLHTHEPSILHRDIKPANIKKTSKGEIFLLDFGLAKGATGQMHTVSTDSSIPGYTPIYSPLEQIIGQGTDQRSDLYALGATLYHLLTGQPPVSAPARFNAIENNQPDPLRPGNQLNVEIAPEVSSCIQKSMALSRRDRFETAQAMRAELEETLRLITDREIARKAEQQLLGTAPDRDHSKPLIVDEGVQFTVYAPEKIKPGKNYSLLAFAHLAKRRADAASDEPDPIEEVKNQAARVLGERREDYRDTKEPSSKPVPRGGQLTFVPVVRGLTFNPPSRSFTWEKSVHREEFDVRASSDVDGQTLTGTMTVFLGSIVIADVGLTISIDSNATPLNEKISLDQGRSGRRVKQVFAAYSEKDEQVVAELAQVAPVFGSRFLLDRTHLEPGEDRAEGLQRLIRDADVFQLFWSNNSMRSPEIADEIKYASGLSRPGFILPTYWEDPVPRSPAEGLPPPEIDRLQFYRIYPGAISQSLQPKVETRLVILGPAGAEIYIDDERQGSIGSSGRVILKGISTGKRILRVTNAGKRDDERVIDVRADSGDQIFQTFLEEPTTLASSYSPVEAEPTGKSGGSDLIVNIQTPGNITLENTVIPGNYLSEHVVSELIDELSLPRITEDGQPVEYILFSLSQRTTLKPGKSLRANGVENGDTVKLISSFDVETVGAGRFASAEADYNSIDVILSVLDTNKSERVEFEADQQVEDVISQIIHTHNLPSRGKFNEPLKYELVSMAMGTRLDRTKTLRAEGIPHLDRLTLIREETAGGPPLQTLETINSVEQAPAIGSQFETNEGMVLQAPKVQTPREADRYATADFQPRNVDTMDSAAPPPAVAYSQAPSVQVPPVAKRSNRWMVPVFAGVAMVFFIVVITPVWFMMKTGSSSVANSTANRNSPVTNTASNTNSTANVSANSNSRYLALGSKFVGIDGRTHRFEDFEGRVVVVNFWATTNGPSKAQVPVLNELEKKYGSQGLTVIGLAKGDTEERVRGFQNETRQDYLVGLSDSELESQLPVARLPVTYLIDRRGRVRKTMIGAQSLDALENAIEPLLSEHR